jgi:hypothetical protein
VYHDLNAPKRLGDVCIAPARLPWELAWNEFSRKRHLKVGCGGIDSMGISEDQLAAVGVLGVALALGLGLLFLLVLLARQTWRWVTGAHPQNSQGHGTLSNQDPGSETAFPPTIASDLFTIRSNLAAVSRQIEDLERKLRLSPHAHAGRDEPARK